MDSNTDEETIATLDRWGGLTVPADAPELARFIANLREREGQYVNYVAACHGDHDPSLGMRYEHSHNRVRIRCWAGCDPQGVIVTLDDINPDSCVQSSSSGGSRPHSITGCTMEQLAQAKQLDMVVLMHLGVRTVRWAAYDVPAVQIPFHDARGNILGFQYRVSLEGDRFRWQRGSKPQLYGQQCLGYQASHGKGVWLVEGCSDVWSLYAHNLAAVGVPGSNNWSEEWVPLFKGISAIMAVIEPDAGGRALRATLEQSKLAPLITFVEPPHGAKDVTESFMRGEWHENL